MSACYSWLAVSGLPSSDALSLLRLETTGEVISDRHVEFSVTELGDGTRLFLSQHFEFADHTPLAELSEGGEVTTCCVIEKMMYSSVSRWSHGKRDWYFVHDGGLGIQHMHTEGEAPPEFHPIANRLMVAQAEGEGIAISVDHVFEVAPEVAKALTGFHFDSENISEFQFQKLAKLES